MIPIILASTLTDRTRPVLDGRCPIPGVTLTHLSDEPEIIFRRTLREAAFDVAELSMGSHIVTTARGDSRYTGIPVFLSRAFRHNAVWIRTDRGINGPADLAGRTIALPEYQQTAALWVRGMLRDQHGVDTRTIKWRIVGERIAITPPPGIDLGPLGETADEALIAGRVDAFVGPRPPAAALAAGAPVARLWPEPRAAEEAYHAATGFFPIMHCLTIRKDVAEANPGLPMALFDTFCAAKNASVREMFLGNVLRVSLPFSHYEAAEQTRLMGGDPWPYGFARNRDEIAAMIRYAVADGLAARPIPPEALFHPSVLDAIDKGP